MRKSEQESETHEQYEVRWKMDKDASPERHGGRIDYGVRTSDGDGTVPLLSTGVMCARHWRDKRLNPSGIRVVSREYPHEPVAAYKDLRRALTYTRAVYCGALDLPRSPVRPLSQPMPSQVPVRSRLVDLPDKFLCPVW
jgi:hypothetical protein